MCFSSWSDRSEIRRAVAHQTRLADKHVSKPNIVLRSVCFDSFRRYSCNDDEKNTMQLKCRLRILCEMQSTWRRIWRQSRWAINVSKRITLDLWMQTKKLTDKLFCNDFQQKAIVREPVCRIVVWEICVFIFLKMFRSFDVRCADSRQRRSVDAVAPNKRSGSVRHWLRLLFVSLLYCVYLGFLRCFEVIVLLRLKNQTFVRLRLTLLQAVRRRRSNCSNRQPPMLPTTAMVCYLVDIEFCMFF